jgi:hypothetical protein
MYCKLPESRKKRSVEFEVLATGYYISVSNNGDNHTDPLTILVYDCSSSSQSNTKDVIIDMIYFMTINMKQSNTYMFNTSH